MTEEGFATLRFEGTLGLLKGRLLSFVRRRVDSPEDAEDIVQDVFFHLIDGNFIDTVEDLSAWLFRAARNRVIDLYRTRSRRQEHPLEEEILSLESVAGEMDRRIWEELQAALLELPEEQRLAFELNELQGKTFREISEETGENINTLLSRKRYAVLYLRERLRYLFEEIK